ncbi:extracellular ligand-gated ion channel protein [Cucumis melo var. makuwa]|uniref:Extracellular ligand-gated ion channel protein n=1 Tax=Cucumis melo var. makuwa TaxID=1194695 RepID=A0A5A7UJ39_CUCMM|nr:extracellular ligand-gated ion channel protein [Cucumis melo var. makuwa]TYK12333.1 extracellular ligand-gated ion channel protein [Cucumis melo var. makuwa]
METEEEKKSQPQMDSQKSKSAESESESELEAAELRRFESFLKWICIMDHSNLYRASLSCIVFFVFGIAVPIASHFALSCSDCDEDHQRPFHVVVQLSLSAVATLSFLCLSLWLRLFGLNRFLFLDKLSEASPKIRAEYFRQLQVSFLPSFLLSFV